MALDVMLKMKHILLLISVTFFGWSCFSNVFIFEEGSSSFLFGLICLIFGFGQISWFANPALIASWIVYFKRNYRLACVFGAAAFLLGLCAIFIKELPKDEAGNTTRVLGFCRGYYLWMSAHFTMLLSSVLLWIKTNKQNKAQHHKPDRADR